MSKKVKFSEPKHSLIINREDYNRPVIDYFRGIKAGTIKDFCSQHAISIKRSRKTCELTGPRDRLQKCIEFLHWCRVPSQLIKSNK